MRIRTKIAAALSLIVMLSTPAFAQYSSLSYFMGDNYQSSMLNPALSPERGYILLPIIGGTGFNVSSNAITVDDLFYSNPNGGGIVPFYDVDIDKTTLLNSLCENNYINADFSTTIFGMGIHTKSIFWDFGINAKASADISIPKGAFELAALSREDGSYSLENLNVSMTQYIETYLGASFNINEKLSMGIRAKFLMGFYNAQLNYDRFDITLNSSMWEISASGMFNATAMGVSLRGDEFEFDALDIEPTFGIMGYGAAIDLGFNYDILDNLSLSVAVTDLGLISWDGNSTIAAETSSGYSFSGYNESDDSSLSDFDVDELLRFESVNGEGRTTYLNSKISAAAEYRFLDDKMAAGVLYTANLRQNYTKQEVTALLSLRPANFFTANISYSFLANQIGAAVNLHTGWINIFAGMDYIPTRVTPQYVPIKSNNVSLFAGVAIPLLARK